MLWSDVRVTCACSFFQVQKRILFCENDAWVGCHFLFVVYKLARVCIKLSLLRPLFSSWFKCTIWDQIRPIRLCFCTFSIRVGLNCMGLVMACCSWVLSMAACAIPLLFQGLEPLRLGKPRFCDVLAYHWYRLYSVWFFSWFYGETAIWPVFGVPKCTLRKCLAKPSLWNSVDPTLFTWDAEINFK